MADLDEFAKALMEHVRDFAIRQSDNILSKGAKHDVAKRWKAAKVRGADVVIPDVVDHTIAALLYAVDQGLLPLVFAPQKGKKLDLTAEGEGELVGWFMGSEGWRSQYSKERFVDDFADLADTKFDSSLFAHLDDDDDDA